MVNLKLVTKFFIYIFILSVYFSSTQALLSYLWGAGAQRRKAAQKALEEQQKLQEEARLKQLQETLFSNTKVEVEEKPPLSKEMLDSLSKVCEKAPPGSIINNQIQANQNNPHINFIFNFFGKDFLKLFKNPKDEFKKHWGSIVKWAKNNKKRIAVYLAVALYLAFEAEIVFLLVKLSDANCWSNWQKEKTMEELYQIPPSKFSQMLLNDVQQHYTSINNPTDFITPLIKFLYDSECEITYLKRYRFIISTLNKFYLNRFFFYNTRLYEDSAERLNRIIFIRSSFLNWLADYKLNQNQKSVLLKKFPNLANYFNMDFERSPDSAGTYVASN